MSPGYEYDNYKNSIDQLKNMFKNRILILGPKNKYEYSKIIKQSLCVLSPPFPETFGCVFSESYYLGTAVIADIQSGAVSEIIDNNNIINYNTPNIVLEKLKQLRENSENISVKIDPKFLIDDILNKWISIL
jgi:glycosyltransferase involved in cell wall biosynthesis